jgi:SRSO17 transposase
MTKRRAIPTAPEPLEAYARSFDDLFERSNQRDEFRRYLEGLLLPTERNKTLTGLANTEPYVGAQHPRAQGMQWFLSEANWQERQVQQRRLRLLLEEPSTAPNGQGVLVIDEHGDRKRGHRTAHIGKQYLANLGKIDTGVVSVTSLWADEGVYYPLDFEPYTPADYFARSANTLRRFAPNSRLPENSCAAPCTWPSRSARWWLITSMARIAGSDGGCVTCKWVTC